MILLLALITAIFLLSENAFPVLARDPASLRQTLPGSYNPAAEYKHFKQFSSYLPMTDGTKIAVQVYLPSPLKEGQKLPVMFEQSRYWRVISLRSPLQSIYRKPLSLYRHEFLSHGYAWVVCDVRGAGASFGDRPWELPPTDIEDSREILQWIQSQPWCKGKIGLIGHSYSGNLAEAALLTADSAIKAAAVLSSPFDLFADVLRPGGLPLEPFLSQWQRLNSSFDQNLWPENLRKLHPFVRGMKPVDEDRDGSILKQALAQHKQNGSVDLGQIKFRDDWLYGSDDQHTATHALCLSLLEKQLGKDFRRAGVDVSSPSFRIKEVAKLGVPIYSCAGWLDGGNSAAAVKLFLNCQANARLLLGPWDHDFVDISPFRRPGISRFRIDREMLKFFDSHIKGQPAACNDLPVQYFTLGREEWRASPTWPPPGAPHTLFLAAKGNLEEQASSTAGSAECRMDKNIGSGPHSRWDCLLGNLLLRPYPDRKARDKKLLVFQSAPLERSQTVSGNPSATLFVKPEGSDCSLFCYLEDVWPDGSVHYVSESQLLCGNRFNIDRPPLYKTVLPARSFFASDYQALIPGQTLAVDLEFMPVSYQFKKFHRIRLSIAGSDADHFQAPSFASLSKQFELKYGAGSASRIVLPVETIR